MSKIYNYGNCAITIVMSNTSSDTVRRATEIFLKRVEKEKREWQQ